MSVREPTYLVLLALADGPLHGYGVAKCAHDLSGGRIRLGAGTLYGALDRLAGDGMVTVSAETVVEGRNRRYYELTPAGRGLLAAETDRLARLAALGRQRLARPGLALVAGG
jgi:DNA-binding PadR family transcriptional regulator